MMDNSTTNDTTHASPVNNAVIEDIMLASFVIALILGSAGNTLVLIVVVGKRARRTVNDIFIMNLAVSDLMFICFLPLFIYENANQRIEKNAALCKFIVPVITATYLLSIFTLTSMSVHRCQVIVNPFKRELSQKRIAAWIGVIWLVSLLVILPLIIVTISNPMDATHCYENWPSMRYKKSYTVTLFVIQYVIPLCVIAVSYIRIGLDLSRSSSNKLPKSAISRARRSENLQVIKTLATIVSLFAIFMLPGQISWLILDFGAEKHKKVAKDMILYTIPVTIFHSCLNPLVYGTVTRQFRRDYMRYLSYLLCCCPTLKSKAIQRYGSPRNTEHGSQPQSRGRQKDNDSVGGDSSERLNGGSVNLYAAVNGSASSYKLHNNNHPSPVLL